MPNYPLECRQCNYRTTAASPLDASQARFLCGLCGQEQTLADGRMLPYMNTTVQLTPPLRFRRPNLITNSYFGKVEIAIQMGEGGYVAVENTTFDGPETVFDLAGGAAVDMKDVVHRVTRPPKQRKRAKRKRPSKR